MTGKWIETGRWTTARRSSAALAALAVGAAAFAMDPPDLSRTRASEAGLFFVGVESLREPPPLNALHEWVVRVESPNGMPVEGATIDVQGGMPMHDHGLPTAPRVTEELGGGDYRLEGMKFQMPGHWTVTLDIATPEATDSVTFDLML